MNDGPVQSWFNRLLEIAVLLVVIGLLLNWAWQLMRPLIPVMAIAAAIGIATTGAIRRLRS